MKYLKDYQETEDKLLGFIRHMTKGMNVLSVLDATKQQIVQKMTKIPHPYSKDKSEATATFLLNDGKRSSD